MLQLYEEFVFVVFEMPVLKCLLASLRYKLALSVQLFSTPCQRRGEAEVSSSK